MAYHVDERILTALRNNSLDSLEIDRLRQHVGECHECLRHLDALRDTVSEVETIIPTVERAKLPHSATSGGLPLLWPMRGASPKSYRRLALVGGGALIAILVAGAALTRPRAPSVIGESVALASTASAPEVSPIELPARRAPAAAPKVVAPKAMVASNSAAPAAARRRAPAVTRAEPAGTFEVAPATVAGFHRIALASAVTVLSGSLRLLDGYTPQHIETGPGDVVPGARADRPVVRLVYLDDEGRTLLLDQQRSAGEPAIAVGDTLRGSTPEGVSVLRWADRGGFWVSLAARMPEEALLAVARRIR